jgi:hypothetical protein
MKKGILFWCFILLTATTFGQQFSQYNTGSLYDSFENPAQRAFIPDTTKNFAFNFFLPNFSSNLFVAGNAQQGIKTRAFASYYNTANLKTGENAYNRLNANINNYAVMFKVFASEHGDQELGLFFNTKGEMRGVATDETLGLFNGFTNFPENSYNNIFNDAAYFQLYHQIGLTYREQVTKRFAFGVKFGVLSGLQYRKVNITQSSISFDKTLDQATLSLEGSARLNGTSGATAFQKVGPSFLNPGGAISIGTMYLDESGYKWQVNIKDLGFIHWNSKSKTGAFSSSALIENFSSEIREKNITGALDSLTSAKLVTGGFTSPTNGLLEVSVNRTYWLNDDGSFKFSPTLVGSKELMYSGFTAALVAPLQMGKYTATLMGSYNDLKLMSIGAQFMVKKDNSEFFIGSERLFQSIALAQFAASPPAVNKRVQVVVNQNSYTGMDFFIGVSFKFGQTIERRLNASYIPDGEKGFFGRTWDKLFGKKDPNY